MRTYLVTGGSGTIGSAIVNKLILSGNRVYLVDIKKPKEQKNVFYLPCDVTDYKSLKDIFETEIKKECLDGVITVAGGALADEWSDFFNTDISIINNSIELNLMGHINAIHACLPYMRSTGDKAIVMISSINGMAAYRIAGYSAAKAGLIGFMYGIAKEMGKNGIRVNIVSPGTVVTELTLNEKGKDWKKLKEGTLTGSFVNPNDIADLVKMIIDNKSIIGQNIVIDCGQVIKK